MNQVSEIEIPVEAATAAALADVRRLEAVGLRLPAPHFQPGHPRPTLRPCANSSA
jgi:hypothetical protein